MPHITKCYSYWEDNPKRYKVNSLDEVLNLPFVRKHKRRKGFNKFCSNDRSLIAEYFLDKKLTYCIHLGYVNDAEILKDLPKQS